MLLRRLIEDELGQGASEYGILVAAVVVLVVLAAGLFSADVQTLFVSIGTYINSAVI
jgi:Flp pilus assembly pilin Flp